MANIKITELNAAGSLAATDVVPVVDVSADETKKITAANLFRTLPDGTAAAPALSFASDQANGVYLAGTDTVGISTGGTQRVTVDGSGNVTISGGLTVEGQTTTVESTIVTIDDKNIELGSVASPSNTTADGGGITLKGATDKTIKWINSTGYWTFNTGIEVGGHLQIDDNNKIKLGTSGDLEIYHNGSNSFIDDAGTGGLDIRSNEVKLSKYTGETLATFSADGPVSLRWNNAVKFETKSDGIDVTGEVQCDSLDVDGTVDIDGGQINYNASSNFLRFTDNCKATFGASDDLQIYHDGSNSFIRDAGAGSLKIRGTNLLLESAAGEAYIFCTADGSTKVYHNNDKKLETTSAGIDVTGEVQCDSLDVDGAADITGTVTLHGHLDLQDNDNILIGSGDDFKLFHNGSNSHIENYTGGLYIDQQLDDGDLVLRADNSTGGLTNYVTCDGGDGKVKLSYYGNQKFETKTDGIDVIGEVQCDSLDVDGAADISGNLTVDTSTFHVDAANNRVGIATTSPGHLLTLKGTQAFEATNSTNNWLAYTYTDNTFRLNYNGSGADEVVITSSGNVGIANNNPSQPLDVTGWIKTSVGLLGTYGRVGLGDSGGPEITTGALAKPIKFIGGNGSANLERMRIDASGRLLLGTTTEGAAGADNLTVADSGTCGVTIRSGTSSNGNIYFSDATSGSGEYAGYIQYRHGDNALVFGDSSAERLRINSSGRVSIGTSTVNSDSMLSVHRDSSDQSQVRFTNTTTGAGGNNGFIVGIDNNEHARLFNMENGPMRFGTNNTEQLRLDASGRLMLGTTTEGNANADNFTIADSANSGLTIRSGSSNIGSIFFSDATSGTGEYAGFVDYNHSSNLMSLGTASTTRVYIDSSGNVGVGAASPNSPGSYAKTLEVSDANSASIVVSRTDSTAHSLELGAFSGASLIESTGATSLRFKTNSSEAFRIDSAGRMLIGTTTEGQASADNLTVADSGACGITIRSGSTSDGSLFFSDATSGASEYAGYVQYDHAVNTLFFGTNAIQRLAINSNGAWGIEGASNYGTSGQVLTSNGNDAPSWQDAGSVAVGGASAISMNDNVKINFGNSSDLQIYHDGSNSRIDNSVGSLIIKNNSDDQDIILTTDNGSGSTTTYLKCDGSNGEVILNHYGNTKLHTKSDGVNVTGEMQCDTLDVDGAGDITGVLTLHNNLDMQDNDQILLGSGDDFKLIHNGSNSHIQNYTGGLYIDQNLDNGDLVLRSDDGSGGLTSYVVCNGGDGQVKLYSYGSQKLNTKSDGIDVTGEVQCDSLDVDGAGDFTGDVTFRGGAAAVNIAANSDIRLASGSWTGDYAGKIQHHSNWLYIQSGSNGTIFRRSNGTNAFQVGSDGTVYPSSSNTYDLGTSSYRWRNIYTNDLNLSNEGSTNDVDGTWGNYTIQEGEDDLFLINRRNGKKYKFNLTEVS